VTISFAQVGPYAGFGRDAGFSADVTPGNTIVIGVLGTPASVTDEGSNTYTQIASYNGSGGEVSAWIAENITDSDNPPFMVSVPSPGVAICAYELTGVATSDTLDQYGTSQGGSGTAVLTASIELAQDDEALMSFIRTNDNCTASNNTSGFTEDYDMSTMRAYHKVCSDVGPHQQSVTLDTARLWTTLLVAIKGGGVTFAPILSRNMSGNPMCARNVSEGSLHG
jgi:hypothetical protein